MGSHVARNNRRPIHAHSTDGTTVTDQTFRGKWLLVYFGYTFCPNTCPMTLNEIATALEKLGADAAKLKPLFITVDPQRDTREVLEQYTQSFDPRIVGTHWKSAADRRGRQGIRGLLGSP